MNMESLIKELQSLGVLRSPNIIEALRKVDRKFFVSPTYQAQAYKNIPLPIGFGQTISQPLTVAIMLESLQPQEKDHVLDVGSGCGWTAALFGFLVGPRGRVTSVERIPQLVELAKKNIDQFKLSHVEILLGDASEGWKAAAPYDIIHVAAAAPTLPSIYKDQLVRGGRLVIPVGEPVQDLAMITKTRDNTYTEHRIPGFQFVPLVTS